MNFNQWGMQPFGGFLGNYFQPSGGLGQGFAGLFPSNPFTLGYQAPIANFSAGLWPSSMPTIGYPSLPGPMMAGAFPTTPENYGTPQAAGGKMPPLSDYPNVLLDESTFTPQELATTKEFLNYLSQDPDGKLLLKNINENYPQGFTIIQDEADAASKNAAAYQQGDKIVLGTIDPSKKQEFLKTLSHEMLHASTPKGTEVGVNGEAFADVLGYRIAQRYGGPMTTTAYGQTIKVDGSQQAEKALYDATVKDASAPDGRWAKAGYQKPDDPNYESTIESKGFQFDFQ